MLKKTKIICTLGPGTDNEGLVKSMAELGMDIARLNFSHGTYDEHKMRIDRVRRVSKSIDRELGILLDIRGPKIRIGTIPEKEIKLFKGDKLVLTTSKCITSKEKIWVNYPYLCEDVKPGSAIFIDDGLIELNVEEVQGKDLICRVVVGGLLTSRKGVTLPDVPIRLPSVMEKDVEDIKYGIKLGVDFIAASFIRKASDVNDVKKVIEGEGANIPVIAKIESREGIDNISDIIDVADGIMIARGDLGVQVPPEDVPLFQKMIIKKCNNVGKPVITATQMLDSMIRNSRPTRAEVADVANAIIEGTDAIMLSGETAIGSYPLEAVDVMVKIACRIERALDYDKLLIDARKNSTNSVADAISHATCQTAFTLDVKAIITSTQTGTTARMVSKYRPETPIIAATPDPAVARELSLIWGVFALLVPHTDNTDDMVNVAISKASERGLLKPHDIVVIAAGIKTGIPGSTNLVMVHKVKDGPLA